MNPRSTSNYETERDIDIILVDQPIHVLSKPGLTDWDRLSPSTALLAEHARIQSSDAVLIFGCHQPALAVFVARNLTSGCLWITDHDTIALDLARKTLAANQVTSVSFLTGLEIPRELYNKFEIVLIHSPKGRSLARRWLLRAHQVLVDGGSLYIAGANQTGIRSTLKDAAELFSEPIVLGYKKGCRVAQLIKKPGTQVFPTWADTPGIAPKTWIEFSVTLSSCTIHIHSLPGVFSYDHLDEGTKMLLDAVVIAPATRVLDVGCGYGVIGLFASLHGAKSVHFIENNLLAVAACKESIALNRISCAEVYSGDLLNPVGMNKYDLILSNPPFHAGLKVEYQIAQALIRQAHHALTAGGRLVLVANKFIRYDDHIKQVFGNVTVLAASNRYHVLSGSKSL